MGRTVADQRLEEERGLVHAWQAGDIEAMGLLYERYAPALRAYCAHRLGNRADADDAVHDTFLKAQHGLGSFDPEVRLWPWLATIAAHVCTDNVRRRLRAIDIELHSSAPRDLEEVVAARVRSAILGDALHSLPPRYRVPLYLKHFAGSTYDEIARLQGRSVASVRSVLMRGRRHLGHRIEAVARGERQWPLPAAVPLTRRFRLRQSRTGTGLLARSMQQLAVVEAGWLASAALLAPTAAAAVAPALWSPPAATATAPTGGGSAPAASPWLPAPLPLAVEPSDVADVEGRQRYARMSTGQADVPGDPPVEGGASVEEDEYHLRVRATATVDVPVYGPLHTDNAVSWNCVKNTGVQGTACAVLIEALKAMPQ